LVNFVKVSSTCFLRHYHTGTKGIVESWCSSAYWLGER
jgi:hypothetical protein